MGSQLQTIIEAIAALPVTVSGSTVAVRFGALLEDSAELPDVPLRILSAPNRATGGKSKTTTLGGAGHLLELEWMLTDLCLLRYVGTGLGLPDIGQVYTDTYMSYANTARQLSANTWTLLRIDLINGVTEYPQGSGNQYHSISALYTVREIIQ
jgi:hypothetical protein